MPLPFDPRIHSVLSLAVWDVVNEDQSAMTNTMERFTEQAQEVLRFAQESAERLQHNYIGTEHLLLGLMHNQQTMAGHILRNQGADERRIQELVERLTRATTRAIGDLLELSPLTRKVLEKAVEEARRMGHHAIGAEHLLLGLVYESEGVAVEVLKRAGIGQLEIIKAVRNFWEPQQTPTNQVAPTEPIVRLSESVKQRLAVAFEEARQMDMLEVEVEHLLLSLLQNNPEIWETLEATPVEIDTLREKLKASIESRRQQ